MEADREEEEIEEVENTFSLSRFLPRNEENTTQIGDPETGIFQKQEKIPETTNINLSKKKSVMWELQATMFEESHNRQGKNQAY